MSDEDFVYKPMPPKRSYLDQYASNDLEAANERIAKLEEMVDRLLTEKVQRNICPLVGKEPRDFTLCDDGDTPGKCLACWRANTSKKGGEE